MLWNFVAKFKAFQQCKNFENLLRFDKVTGSLKVGTFLRHSVEGLVSWASSACRAMWPNVPVRRRAV